MLVRSDILIDQLAHLVTGNSVGATGSPVDLTSIASRSCEASANFDTAVPSFEIANAAR